MTTINAESLLKSMAFDPGRLGIGELYPAVDVRIILGTVEVSQLEWRTVWPRDALYTFSTVPENMYVSSSSTLDVGRIIAVIGLDSQFNEIVGYGITNGQVQSIVTSLPGAGTALEFFRVNGALDLTLSTTIHSADGDIYVAASDAAPSGVPSVANTRRMIVQGFGGSFGFIYTTPAGKTLFPKWVLISQSGDKQIELRWRGRQMFWADSTLMYSPELIYPLASAIPGMTEFTTNPSILSLPEQTDLTIEARGTSPVSGILTIATSASLINNKAIKNYRGGIPDIL